MDNLDPSRAAGIPVSGGPLSFGSSPAKVDQRRKSTLGGLEGHTTSTSLPKKEPKDIEDATAGKLPDLTPRCSVRRPTITKLSEGAAQLGRRMTRFFNKLGRIGDDVAQTAQTTAKQVTAGIEDPGARIRDRLASVYRREAQPGLSEEQMEALDREKAEIQADLAAAPRRLSTVEQAPLGTTAAKRRSEIDLITSNIQRAARGLIRTPEQKALHTLAKNQTFEAGHPEERRKLTDDLSNCYSQIADIKKAQDKAAGRPETEFSAESFTYFLEDLQEDPLPPNEFYEALETLKDVQEKIQEKLSPTLPKSLSRAPREEQISKIQTKLKDEMFQKIKAEILAERMETVEDPTALLLKLGENTPAEIPEYVSVSREAEKRLNDNGELNTMLQEIAEAENPYEAGVEFLTMTHIKTETIRNNMIHDFEDFEDNILAETAAKKEEISSPQPEIGEMAESAQTAETSTSKPASGFQRALRKLLRTSEQQKIHDFAKSDAASISAGRPSEKSERWALTDSLDESYTIIAEYKKSQDKANAEDAGVPSKVGPPFSKKEELTAYIKQLNEDPPSDLPDSIKDTLKEIKNLHQKIAEKSSFTLPMGLQNESHEVKIAQVKEKIKDAVFNSIKLQVWSEAFEEAQEAQVNHPSAGSEEYSLASITRDRFNEVSKEVTAKAAKRMDTDSVLKDQKLTLRDLLKQIDDAKEPYTLGVELLEQINIQALRNGSFLTLSDTRQSVDFKGNKVGMNQDPASTNRLALYFQREMNDSMKAEISKRSSHVTFAKEALQSFDTLNLIQGGTTPLQEEISKNRKELESAQSNLKTAQDSYNKFQEQLDEANSELTEAKETKNQTEINNQTKIITELKKEIDKAKTEINKYNGTIEKLQVQMDAQQRLQDACDQARNKKEARMKEIGDQMKEGLLAPEQAQDQLAQVQIDLMKEHDDIVKYLGREAFVRKEIIQGIATQITTGLSFANQETALNVVNNNIPTIAKLPPETISEQGKAQQKAAASKNEAKTRTRYSVEAQRQQLVEAMSKEITNTTGITLDSNAILAKVTAGLDPKKAE